MKSRALLLLVSLSVSGFASAQTLSQRPEPVPAPVGAPAAANSDPTYQQLRNVGLSGEVAAANNLVLKRDAGTFTFRSGSLYFLAPVNGKVTGAVFVGDGSFTLAPPLEVEKRTLSLLTKGSGLAEEFSEAVLRFTDGTYEEVRKVAGGSTGPPAGNAAGILSDHRDTLRKKLHWNLAARLLQDVLSAEPGGFFAAFIKGKKYNGKLLYVVDPHGAPLVQPEEVSLSTYDENNYGIWAAFHYSSEYAAGTASGTQKNAVIHVEHQKLDAQIEKSGKLSGTAVTTFVSRANGLRVVPFNLFPALRVESVSDASGQALAFIQEDKNDDPDFGVILPKALAAGEHYTLKTAYSGKEAVSDEGAGNYYPVARSTWYPNSGFGDYAQYEMTFRVPKSLTLVGSGTLVREVVEGDWKLSEWRSEVPHAVAGFNLGQFRREEQTLPDGTVIQSYANENPPNDWNLLSGSSDLLSGSSVTGNISTVSLMKKPLGEALGSVEIYTDYFGPIAYKRVAMTQQTACTFGQAWPALVYMPICSFFDDTQRHFFGLDDTRGYWKSVASHEVAHQWWGHTVGWSSYRDQWMSEGFAEFSASLFMQRYYPKEYREIWKDQLELMTEKNKEGRRPIDVGPLTLGYRLGSSKAGFDIYRRLIYPKGSFVLHMLRMMMWNPQSGDARFKEMMHDFVRTYANRPASTEDFKAMVEKHMIPAMDLAGNGKMEWFFNEYVYGTALPDYKFEHSFSQGADGSPVLNMKITQSNVGPDFMMQVPVYLEFANGKVIRLGAIPMAGNTTAEQHVPLTGLKEKPKRATLAYMNDVLCTQDGK